MRNRTNGRRLDRLERLSRWPHADSPPAPDPSDNRPTLDPDSTDYRAALWGGMLETWQLDGPARAILARGERDRALAFVRSALLGISRALAGDRAAPLPDPGGAGPDPGRGSAAGRELRAMLSALAERIAGPS